MIARAGQLTLTGAAAEFGLGYRELRAAVDAGLIRYRERYPWGAGESILFDSSELEADLAGLPRCDIDGCERPVLTTSGYCGVHFAHAGRAAAANREREVLESARDWYTQTEAVEFAGTAEGTVRRARLLGELAFEKVGRHVRIPVAALEHWAESLPPKDSRIFRRDTLEDFERNCTMAKRLHGRGETLAVMGELLDRSLPTVRKYLDAAGVERPGRGRQPRRLTPEARAARVAEAVRLYTEEGLTADEIASTLDSSATQIRRDLRGAGVVMRTGSPRPTGDAPEERRCTCGERFTPAFPSQDDRMFCSDRCAKAARREHFRAEIERQGLVSVRDASEQLGVDEVNVREYIRKGLLNATKIVASGFRPGYGIAPEELKRFTREWVRGGDGRRHVWLDENKALDRWESGGRLATFAANHGHSLNEARTLIGAHVRQRRERFANHNRGRRAATGPIDRHMRWLESYPRTEQDLFDLFNEDVAIAVVTKRPTTFDVARAIALDDWQQHPEDWSRKSYPPAPNDPESLHPLFARTAANRVSKALKALQNTHTEIRAA